VPFLPPQKKAEKKLGFFSRNILARPHPVSGMLG
jgi:hypothetical protein